MNTIYTVFHRLRAKKVENLVGSQDSFKYDNNEIVFQSFSKDRAIDYYDNLAKVDDAYWKSISKGVIITPIDSDRIDNLVDNDTVKMTYWN